MVVTPGHYRKKPVIIEAWQIVSYVDLVPIASWVNANGGTMTYGQHDPGPAYGNILTTEGVMRADVGDWVIKGVQGQFYPCKPVVFAMTHEDVDDHA